MSMFDGLLGSLGGAVNLEELAARAGITPEQLAGVTTSLQGHLQGGAAHADALQQAAADHGLSLESLQGIFAQGGALSGLTAMLDRDGDGNPLNDLGGFFNRS